MSSVVALGGRQEIYLSSHTFGGLKRVDRGHVNRVPVAVRIAGSLAAVGCRRQPLEK